MARDRPLMDLRREEREGARFELSMTFAAAAAVVLALSGILIALILPELFAQGATRPEAPNTELSALMSLTIDEVMLEDLNISNAPLDQVMFILMKGKGTSSGLDQQVREFVSQMLPMIIGDDTAYRVKSYSGQGQEADWEMVSALTPPTDIKPLVQSLELRPPSYDAETGPMTITLEIWQGRSL